MAREFRQGWNASTRRTYRSELCANLPEALHNKIDGVWHTGADVVVTWTNETETRISSDLWLRAAFLARVALEAP